MQRVASPRIYVSLGDYFESLGVINYENSYPAYYWGEVTNFRLNPSSGFRDWEHTNENGKIFQRLELTKYFPINSKMWTGCFAHNLASCGQPMAFGCYVENLGAATNQYIGFGENPITFSINGDNRDTACEYDGFTLQGASMTYPTTYNRLVFRFKIEGATTGMGEQYFYPSLRASSMCFGNYYEFPVNANLNLNMTIENDGITTQKTKGGVTLSDVKYKGSPKWGDLGAWELAELSESTGQLTSWSRNAQLGARTGRRSWDITFSHLSGKQVLPINSLGTKLYNIDTMSSYTEDEDYYDGGHSTAQYFHTNILNGEDFFSAVFNRTLGGRLPFIFQPDKNNNNPDQLAICKFQQDSLDIDRVAPNLYNIKLKIREVW